MLEKLPNILI